MSKVCVLSFAPQLLHVFFCGQLHDELNLITHGFHNGNSPVSLNPLMTPKDGKKTTPWITGICPPSRHISRQEGLWSPPSSPKKNGRFLLPFSWTKRRQKNTKPTPSHCRPANLHHPSPQRPQSFQGLDEILWSKPPGESWCNGPLFWGSKPLVFWSRCIWIQLIGDQVSPQCWLACCSLMVSSRCSIGGTLTMGQDTYTYYIVGKSIYHKNFVSFWEDFTLVAVWRLISHFVLSVTSIKQTPFFGPTCEQLDSPQTRERPEGLGDTKGLETVLEQNLDFSLLECRFSSNRIC